MASPSLASMSGRFVFRKAPPPPPKAATDANCAILSLAWPPCPPRIFPVIALSCFIALGLGPQSSHAAETSPSDSRPVKNQGFASTIGQEPSRSPIGYSPVLPAAKGLPAQRNFAYPWSWVWRATIRLLVVDRGFVVDQQDENSGFILFHEAADPQKEGAALRGSIELIALDANNKDGGVRLLARIENGGTHAAFSLLGALEQKVRREHGPPPTLKAPPTETPPPKAPNKPHEKS